jgi:hypothetical protein
MIDDTMIFEGMIFKASNTLFEVIFFYLYVVSF